MENILYMNSGLGIDIDSLVVMGLVSCFGFVFVVGIVVVSVVVVMFMLVFIVISDSSL